MSLDADADLYRRLGPELYDLYTRRVGQHQDLVVLVSDIYNRRGTGKSVLSLKLADAFDRTDDGLTEQKCVMSAEALTQAYKTEPKGSALILDEAELSVSKYDAGSATNRAVRRLVSMGRIREKYTVLNLPASAQIDRDLKALCDVWILVERKGRARVHFLKYNPYGEHPLNENVQSLEWADLNPSSDLAEIYDSLTEEKERRIDGDGDSSTGYVRASTAEEQAERAAREARQDQRDQVIESLVENTDLDQREIADAVDLSRSRISQIVNS